ncbi:universal stress protein [Rhodospirillaceae bacterium SYSU D60014]|uniref:universal stress protein n=1 Tax=Virgifigura deserti TaxID=2268457 RepID=UPI000E674EE7
MTIKSILVLADGGPGNDAALQMAVTAARQFSAHLDVLHVRADPETMIPIVGEGMSGAMVEQMMDAMTKAAEERVRRARAGFDAFCAGSGLSVAWRDTEGREPEEVAFAGRCSDLIVIAGAEAEGEGNLAATLDAALFDSARPVLVASQPLSSSMAPSMGAHAAICWNGSIQSARAVGAALPFLRHAERVTVLTADEADRRVPAAMLRSYLARHDIRAMDEPFKLGSRSIGKGLLEQAKAVQADLIVMGAYGHSRLREMILGGATRELLSSSSLPVLMAH